MISFTVLIPSLFYISSKEYNIQIVRDFLLLSLVLAIRKFNISAPYTIFVSLGMYTLLCEMINDLSYKLLPPNLNLKHNWLQLQKKQTQELVVKLLELRKNEPK